MKKHIIIAALILGISPAFAQQKQAAFKVPFEQKDLQQQFQLLSEVSKKVHTLKMDALVRDTIDNYLGLSFQIINKRYREAFVADSVANSKAKK
jgi:uncharacterized protein YdeI (BOF family)